MAKRTNSEGRTVIEADSIMWELNSDDLNALLEGPEVLGMWYNALDKLRDKANEMAQTEDAEYGSAVHRDGNAWGFEPGGYIYTKNYEARVDDEYHDTLINVYGLAGPLIEEAAEGWDIGQFGEAGKGYTYTPRGKGSPIRDKKGQYTKVDGLGRGGKKKRDDDF